MIAGWVLKYLSLHLLGTTTEFAQGDFAAAFARFVAKPLGPIGWHLAFMGLTIVQPRLDSAGPRRRYLLALSQVLFSMGGGHGVVVTYGSYLGSARRCPPRCLPSPLATHAWIGAAFFALLTIAALTSAGSLLQVVIAFAMALLRRKVFARECGTLLRAPRTGTVSCGTFNARAQRRLSGSR